ncbi:hypothetical protein [Acidisphaera sp. S103]|uniref:hypothetical protein n=1 Tax=Acidisphaera sp. S103 TaxID=1747223 RepID=UPI00131CCFFC|nr:hypothetical protein [Acidisphaera sp. S103]
MAAAADCARPDEMTGIAKIMAAAGEAGVPPLNDQSGIRKIMEAAAEGQRRAAADGTDRIRQCAGLPTRAEEEMAKALADLDTLESQGRRTPAPTPRRSLKPQPSRIAGRHDVMPAPPGAFRRPTKPPPRPITFNPDGGFAYFEFRDRLAGDMRGGFVGAGAARLMEHAHDHYGIDKGDASEWVEKFMLDMIRHRERKRMQVAQWRPDLAGPET